MPNPAKLFAPQSFVQQRHHSHSLLYSEIRPNFSNSVYRVRQLLKPAVVAWQPVQQNGMQRRTTPLQPHTASVLLSASLLLSSSALLSSSPQLPASISSPHTSSVRLKYRGIESRKEYCYSMCTVFGCTVQAVSMQSYTTSLLSNSSSLQGAKPYIC